MNTIILASLISASAASPPPLLISLVQASTVAAQAADAPKSRKACRNIPIPNSRFTKRVCSEVVERPADVQEPVSTASVIATLAVGMSVVDPQGGVVGSITAMGPDGVTVQTDRHQAKLPQSSFTVSNGKALFAMSQAELNASIDELIAANPAPELKVGAEVRGAKGASIGTIDALDAANVTITLASERKISIPRSSIAAQADGSGMIAWTASELEAQVKAAQPGQ